MKSSFAYSCGKAGIRLLAAYSLFEVTLSQELKIERSTVDWGSARATSEQQSGFAPDQIRPEFADIINNAPVPVRIPAGLVDSFGGFGLAPDGKPRCTMTGLDDGYSLRCKGKNYDVQVDAKTKFIRTDASKEIPKTQPPRFEEVLGGARVTLRLDGVLYILSFECTDPKHYDEEQQAEEGDLGCITEKSALGTAESLVIVGGKELKP